MEKTLGMKKISFVLPSYNSEKWVASCLESIYRQGLKSEEFEIICIDDGSTDGTAMKISEIANTGKDNIRLFRQKNQGPGIARNKGINEAKAEYLMFVDSDDYLADNCVPALIKCADASLADIVYYDCKVTSDEKLFNAEYIDLSSKDAISGKTFFAKYRPNNSACAMLIRTSFLRENNIYFDEGFCEDGRFSVRAYNKANRCVYSKTDVYRYVRRPDGTVSNENPQHLKAVLDGFIASIKMINDIISSEKNNDYSQALIARRNDYIFHLQGRLAKGKFSNEIVRNTISTLRANNCYPYSLPDDYHGLKYIVLHKLFCNEKLFVLLTKMYRKFACKLIRN